MTGILGLSVSELFILSRGEELLVNRKLEIQVVPLSGDATINYALITLGRQHQDEFVAKRVRALVAEASPTVQYNRNYRPQQGKK